MDDATVTMDLTDDDWEAALVATARGDVMEDDEDSDGNQRAVLSSLQRTAYCR